MLHLVSVPCGIGGRCRSQGASGVVRISKFEKYVSPVNTVHGHLAFLHAALEIVHHQRGLVHVLDVKLGLRTSHLQAQVEPDILRDIDRAGEAGPVVDLPVQRQY